MWGNPITAEKGKWTTFTLDNYVPDDTTVSDVKYDFSTTENYFFIESASGTEDYYLDDISIIGDKPEEPEEPELDDLISNGSFEVDPIDENWKGMGSAQVARVTDVAHEGNASLKVSGYSAGWEGGRYELLGLWKDGTLVSGKKYTLTAWAKTESGSGTLTPTIKGQIDGADKYTGFGTAAQVNSTEWTKITGDINLADYDTDTNVLEVYWSWGQTTAEGAPAVFYLDDVTLTTPSDNIIRNGSFEKGLEKWTGYEQGETEILTAATDEFHSGSQSVKVANRTKCSNGPAQDVSNKLKPGSKYKVSA